MGETIRNGVRGFSMWPNLIPGDILQAQYRKAGELKRGMIAVFPGMDPDSSTVHRVVSVDLSFENRVLITSAGDRSGIDRDPRQFTTSLILPVITGVLRRGQYRPVGSMRIPERLSPELVVRLWCTIVRRMLW